MFSVLMPVYHKDNPVYFARRWRRWRRSCRGSTRWCWSRMGRSARRSRPRSTSTVPGCRCANWPCRTTPGWRARSTPGWPSAARTGCSASTPTTSACRNAPRCRPSASARRPARHPGRPDRGMRPGYAAVTGRRLVPCGAHEIRSLPAPAQSVQSHDGLLPARIHPRRRRLPEHPFQGRLRTVGQGDRVRRAGGEPAPGAGAGARRRRTGGPPRRPCLCALGDGALQSFLHRNGLQSGLSSLLVGAARAAVFAAPLSVRRFVYKCALRGRAS
jgi:hypothetical protein